MICDCKAGQCKGAGIYNCRDWIERSCGPDGLTLAEYHLRRIAELEAMNAWLKTALEKIASCDVRHVGDVVDVAREALKILGAEVETESIRLVLLRRRCGDGAASRGLRCRRHRY